jgi:DNA-binding winged helix-turn-helix (wHTH) protein/tetratricopeptide (TPR) repeat protein
VDGHGGRDAPEPIVLGHEPSFLLGPLKAEPAFRRLSRGDEEEFVQPRVMQVLVALARAEGAVLTRDDLIGSCWAGAIVTDDALNRIVSQVRKLADGIGRGAFTVETVARVGYRMHRHEAEPEPEPEPEPVPVPVPVPVSVRIPSPSPPSPEPLRRRRLPRWPWAVVALLLAAAAGWWLLRPESPRLPRLVLAPFAAGPGVPADLPRNLDTDLRSALSNDRVALAEGAADLELGGSIRREGTGLRFTIIVARPRGGATLLTFTRDIPAGEPVAELVGYLSRFLGCGTGFSRYPGQLPDRAQALMLQYCMKMVAGGSGARAGMLLDLSRALTAEAPDFAIGWALIAEAVGLMPPPEQTPALIAEARDAARRATEIDPGQPLGFTRLAMVMPASEPVERERLMRNAVELAERGDGALFQSGFPQATLGDGLMQSGRLSEAASIYERAVDQDRTSPYPSLRLAFARYAQGRTVEANALMERLVASIPRQQLDRIRAARAIYGERWTEAAELVRAPTPEEQAALSEAFAALDSGNAARIARAGQALAALPIDPARESLVVPMLARLGAVDAAFAAFERSRVSGGLYAAPFARPGTASAGLFDPGFAAVRRDPRFAAHLRRAGFYPYWHATRSRPDECATPGPPPYCAAIR